MMKLALHTPIAETAPMIPFFFHFHSLGSVFFACQLHDNIASPSPVVQVPCDQRRNLLSLSRQQLQVMFDILATNSNQIFDLHITSN